MYEILSPSSSILPVVGELEMTELRYPIIYEKRRGRPPDEKRFVGSSPSNQRCSRCHQAGANFAFPHPIHLTIIYRSQPKKVSTTFNGFVAAR
jgi:hypothetical protein